MTARVVAELATCFSRNVINKEWNKKKKKKKSIGITFDLDDVEGWENEVGIDASKIQGRTYTILVTFEPFSIVVSGHSFIRYFFYGLSILSFYEHSSSRVELCSWHQRDRQCVSIIRVVRSFFSPPPICILNNYSILVNKIQKIQFKSCDNLCERIIRLFFKRRL